METVMKERILEKIENWCIANNLKEVSRSYFNLDGYSKHLEDLSIGVCFKSNLGRYNFFVSFSNIEKDGISCIAFADLIDRPNEDDVRFSWGRNEFLYEEDTEISVNTLNKLGKIIGEYCNPEWVAFPTFISQDFGEVE